jgi:hypothetical protein
MGDGTETDDDSDGEMPELESDSSSEDESSDWDYDDDTDEECDEQLGLRDRIRGTDEAHGPEDPADASWMREGLARAAAHDPEMSDVAGGASAGGFTVPLAETLGRLNAHSEGQGPGQDDTILASLHHMPGGLAGRLACAPLLDSGTARDAECGCARSCLGQFVVDQGTYHAKLTGQIDQARAKARDTKSEHGNAVLATRVYQGGDTSSINAGASMGGDDMERLEGEIADGDARHCFLPTVPP